MQMRTKEEILEDIQLSNGNEKELRRIEVEIALDARDNFYLMFNTMNSTLQQMSQYTYDIKHLNDAGVRQMEELRQTVKDGSIELARNLSFLGQTLKPVVPPPEVATVPPKKRWESVKQVLKKKVRFNIKLE